MSSEGGTVYEMWTLEPPPSSVRARLYGLSPIGVGTTHAESLSSYVTRLAEAHAVDVHTVMRDEIYPRMEPRRSLRRWAFNANGLMARRAVDALEDLTGRVDLRYMTFVPWARVVNVTPLLRRDKAWCPRCYAEWRRAGHAIYEPLLWAV